MTEQEIKEYIAVRFPKGAEWLVIKKIEVGVNSANFTRDFRELYPKITRELLEKWM